MKGKNLGSSALIAGTLALGMAPAWAQESGPKLEEIVVTAAKVEQNLADVGSSINVVSAEQLREARVEQVVNLTAQVPNFTVKEQFPGLMPVVTIRGVGLDDYSSTNNPAAGIYVDEVPLASMSLMNSEYFDLERVEVLKGPQGTLYGRNSTAGALNVISAKPTQNLEASAQLGYGNYEAFSAEGMLNVPIADTLQVRIAAKYNDQAEGFQESDVLAGDYNPLTSPPVPGKRTIGKRKLDMERLQIAWQPSEAFDANLKVERQHSDSQLGQGQPCGLVFGPTIGEECNTSDPYKGSWNAEVPYDFDQNNYTGTLHANVGFANLTSITSYIDFERYLNVDGDATSFSVLHPDQADRLHQFTQELRLDRSGDTVDWIVGAFYSEDKVFLDQTLDFGSLLAFIAPGALANAPCPLGGASCDLAALPFPFNLLGLPNGAASGSPGYFANPATWTNTIRGFHQVEQKGESTAGFVNATWHLTQSLDLITGVRFTSEEKTFQATTQWGPCPDVALLGFGDFSPACYLGLAPSATASTAALTGGGPDTLSNDSWAYRAQLNWKAADDLLLYAFIAEGTKSGGFYSQGGNASAQYAPFDQETLRDYEAGLKWQLSNVYLDVAAFYYDYEDAQVRSRAPGTFGDAITNIGSSNLYGLDFNVTYVPMPDLTLSSGVGWVKSELGTFIDTNGAAVPKGNEFPGAPELTANVSARYEFGLTSNLRAALQGTAYYSDTYFVDAKNDPTDEGEEFTEVNLRASVFNPDGGWEFALWGKNVTDEVHRVNGINVPSQGVNPVYFNAPRTWGGTVSWRFD